MGRAVTLTPPPPAPPPPRRSRARRLTAIAEAAVAAAILLSIGIAEGPASSNHHAGPPWARHGAPAVAALVDDINALETASSPAAGDFLTALRRDLTTAEGLPWPPDSEVASVWTSSLGSLEAAIKALTLDGAVPTPQALRSVSANLASAAQGLDSVEKSMARG